MTRKAMPRQDGSNDLVEAVALGSLPFLRAERASKGENKELNVVGLQFHDSVMMMAQWAMVAPHLSAFFKGSKLPDPMVYPSKGRIR